jgi:hypothetical protein
VAKFVAPSDYGYEDGQIYFSTYFVKNMSTIYTFSAVQFTSEWSQKRQKHADSGEKGSEIRYFTTTKELWCSVFHSFQTIGRLVFS